MRLYSAQLTHNTIRENGLSPPKVPKR